MSWMIKWPGKFPVFVKEGKGPYFTDVDGNKYLDFCLGDTGAMTGHAPEKSTQAIIDQVKKGITFMLPSEDGVYVAEELQRRFGLHYWQLALTATDANRFSIRLCRHITQRPKILVFNWCYHGTVDETFIVIENGKPKKRPGNLGSAVDPTTTTRVVEFNDLPALKEALSHGDVACVLAEPAMTNIGIIHPKPGYWEAAQKIIKDAGSLLIIDETHTICTGPGGYTKAYGLKPDVLVIGKPIASGIPAAVYGFTKDVAKMITTKSNTYTIDTSGIGGTLAGNALSLAAIRATLSEVLTQESFDKTTPLAIKFTEDVQKIIDTYRLPWSITRLGNRAEYWFRGQRPQNGGEAASSADADLDYYMHLFCLNRGILMTPFHNMALIAPSTTVSDIEYHTKVFHEAVLALLGKNQNAKL
eukprot:TRINITY_DN4535_c0_g1_i1.p1 TRINITY_DN4535_c0_g1~~TRINITY_DN4535_c0_g1_i1.p1  ORF type:complete len:415 (-),score=100.08 TRINITY_DN4535_c0_g1_i1:116-1360(-)